MANDETGVEGLVGELAFVLAYGVGFRPGGIRPWVRSHERAFLRWGTREVVGAVKGRPGGSGGVASRRVTHERAIERAASLLVTGRPDSEMVRVEVAGLGDDVELWRRGGLVVMGGYGIAGPAGSVVWSLWGLWTIGLWWGRGVPMVDAGRGWVAGEWVPTVRAVELRAKGRLAVELELADGVVVSGWWSGSDAAWLDENGDRLGADVVRWRFQSGRWRGGRGAQRATSGGVR